MDEATLSPLFNPISPFYHLLQPHTHKIFYGGRGAAKSWTVAEALVRISCECRVRILCAREFQKSIAMSVRQLLVDQITRLGMYDKFYITEKTITNIKTGSTFGFIGLHHNVKNIKSITGIDILWVEEAETTSAESIRVVFPTIRDPGSEIWCTFNTDLDTDPIYKRFVLDKYQNTLGPGGPFVAKVSWRDNPFFSEEMQREREYYLRMISSAPDDSSRAQAQSDYDTVWEGEPRRMAFASIIKRWAVEEFEPPSNPRWFHGCDWGFAADPTAIVRFFIDDDVLYIDNEAFGHGVEFDEIPQLFRSIPTTENWPIKADCSRPETISYVRKKGYNISAAKKWPGSVEDGIGYLNGFRKIIIHPRCKNMIEEAKLYSFKIDRTSGDILPIIRDAHNHGWDAVRYGLDGYILGKGGLMQVNPDALKMAMSK